MAGWNQDVGISKKRTPSLVGKEGLAHTERIRDYDKRAYH